ncbi:MAG TPA: hypothetical protein VJH20_00875 [Candidatus Nanoarchaeia archaeon]|nr:hypothetical protein [Candidatus Nanoarchaeia archaeon]
MPIIGFNFDNINAERDKKVEGKINIKQKIGITNISLEKLPLNKEEEVLKFNFEFLVDYEPSFAKIHIKGHVLSIEDPKLHKEILDKWKKSKKINQEMLNDVFNVIVSKCTIKALGMSQDINVPPLIPLPRVQPAKEPQEYIG